MGRLFFLALALVMGTAAQAQVGAGNGIGNSGAGNGNGNGNGSNNTLAAAAAAGSSSSVSVGGGSGRNTPGVWAPGLAAAGIESCLGSASVGGAGPGIGVTIGSTMTDKGCNLRLYARTLYSLGHRIAATQILCNDPDVALALAVEGVRCLAGPGAETQRAVGFSPSGDDAAVADLGRDARSEFEPPLPRPASIKRRRRAQAEPPR
ncbi:hypothetical protein MKL09_10470 [Methylobacterium sp. J-048]|uniref:hypothetical protein n=1 Tax=Methylobacterium sp. J-048 TaxID=2836635 RepID=UPI001FBB475D|nr:hypothetical protein [Methylobacterium sp. J-048]MCJ2056976.1 hypothetical protein [Methylobacterium sp. J-048]